jgi:hypothetical protein
MLNGLGNSIDTLLQCVYLLDFLCLHKGSLLLRVYKALCPICATPSNRKEERILTKVGTGIFYLDFRENGSVKTRAAKATRIQ